MRQKYETAHRWATRYILANGTGLILLTISLLLPACQKPDAEKQADEKKWWSQLPRPEWQKMQRFKVSQEGDWYEVYQPQPSVFAIYEPGHWQEAIAYLIVGDQKSLLFDTLLGIGDIKHVVSQLTDLEVIVLNSHSHFDHIGGNHQFEIIYALDNVYSQKSAHGLDNQKARRFVEPGSIWKPTPAAFSPETYHIEPYMITKTVKDGDCIDLGGRELEIVESPGHAPDALCLLDRENRLLFTGDTFYLAPLYAQLPGSDFDAYARTAHRLSGLAEQVDWLLPGHNVTNVPASYLQKLDEAFQAIQNRTAAYKDRDGAREYAFGKFSIMVKKDDF